MRHLQITAKHSAQYQVSPIMDSDGMVGTESKLVKNSQIKILKSHAHLHITGRKPTKFQVNLMKDVGGVAETRSIGRTAGETEGLTWVISKVPLCLRRVTKMSISKHSQIESIHDLIRICLKISASRNILTRSNVSLMYTTLSL